MCHESYFGFTKIGHHNSRSYIDDFTGTIKKSLCNVFVTKLKLFDSYPNINN